jgi:DNA-binding transcriptional MerR regulator
MTDPAVSSGAPEIPDKLYFRIGEVAGLLAVEPHVLRYWETEFPGLAPKKSGTGHRLYRRKDVELLLKIKHLLYEKRYTIEGARQSLLYDSKASKPKPPDRRQRDLFAPDPLAAIRTELSSILKILK